MMELLWGHKSSALFDVWSVEHILAGLSIGSLVIKGTARLAWRNNFPEDFALRRRFDVVMVLMIAFLWETVEHYLELGLLGSLVTDWFAGVEYWGNRIITDPLMVLAGYVLVRNRPGLVWPARVLSALWLLVHVFVFPHSMYLHEIEWSPGVDTLMLASAVVAIAAAVAAAAPGVPRAAAAMRRCGLRLARWRLFRLSS